MTLAQYRTLSLNQAVCPRCSGSVVAHREWTPECIVLQRRCLNCGWYSAGSAVPRYAATRAVAPKGCPEIKLVKR